MALIKCENVSIGYEGQMVVHDLILRLIRETTSVLSEKMVPEKVHL